MDHCEVEGWVHVEWDESPDFNKIDTEGNCVDTPPGSPVRAKSSGKSSTKQEKVEEKEVEGPEGTPKDDKPKTRAVKREEKKVEKFTGPAKKDKGKKKKEKEKEKEKAASAGQSAPQEAAEPDPVAIARQKVLELFNKKKNKSIRNNFAVNCAVAEAKKGKKKEKVYPNGAVY
jgi:hypothetical protein